MMNLSLENVEKYLSAKGVPVQLHGNKTQLHCIKSYKAIQCPVFFRIYANSSLLQMLLFFPFSIKPGAESDLARFLHFINKEIDLPGFGIDDNTGTVFYRLTLPSYENKIEKELIGIYLDALDRICESFLKTISSVAEGKISYSDAINQVKNIYSSLKTS